MRAGGHCGRVLVELREIELAAATTDQIQFLPGLGCGLAVFSLPVSKADPMALGKARSLSCACPSRACPVAALRKLWLRASARPRSALDACYLVSDLRGAQVLK